MLRTTGDPPDLEALDEASAPAIDDLDRALVERLRTDGRESNRSLARALGVNEATIATRLRRLEAGGMMRVVALTDMAAYGYDFLAFAFINVSGRPLLEVADEIGKIASALSVSIVSGRFDLVVTVLAHDRAELAAVIGGRFGAIDGVVDVRAEFALEVLRYDSDWAALDATAGPPPDELTPRRMDEVDLAIVRALQHDARQSNRAIAAQLSVSEGTIRTRLRRMESAESIHIKAIKGAAAFGLAANAFVGVKVAGGQVAGAAQALLDTPGVAIAARTLGEFDFVIVVMAESTASLIGVLLERLGGIPQIRATETFENFMTPKHVYTWARLHPDTSLATGAPAGP
jgi:DNA-binding Lrp family transcriptional regulator